MPILAHTCCMLSTVWCMEGRGPSFMGTSQAFAALVHGMLLGDALLQALQGLWGGVGEMRAGVEGVEGRTKHCWDSIWPYTL